MTIENYKAINQSYSRSLVFHFGCFAGFFSEYNNMLKAMAFCLANKIQFKLYSKDATICPEKGWTDFFEPFVDEEKDEIHHVRNYRFNERRPYTSFYINYLKKKIKHLRNRNVAIPHFSLKQRFFTDVSIKRRCHFSFYTHELWDDFEVIPYDKVVKVSTFFHGSYFDLLRQLNSLIWVYNPVVSNLVASVLDSLELPVEYVGLHIRSGDKEKEASIIKPEVYVDVSRESYSNVNVFFVFTDDYSNIERLTILYPDCIFYTLCQPDERGYYYDDLVAETPNRQYEKTIRMFASVELLSKSLVFIGTKSSNPFQFVEIKRNRGTCISLD